MVHLGCAADVSVQRCVLGDSPEQGETVWLKFQCGASTLVLQACTQISTTVHRTCNIYVLMDTLDEGDCLCIDSSTEQLFMQRMQLKSLGAFGAILQGLNMFPAMVIVPTMQIAWTLLSIISGML